ncbi:hypothetical protein ABDD95_08630 [Mucilaginibacter sp. PAMB04274]|uniref:hypothetical protein n=1 Tax=Mucilaginibacter sp. PAMB04274 TaxID=3138568 RepID=UPI0031F5FC12
MFRNLTFTAALLLNLSAFAQKWQPGYFFDTKGNKVPGLIQIGQTGKGPIKNEGFIIYKDNPKANEIKLSASDIKYYVAGKDSFIVAHPPSYETWPKAELDFVRVELDEPLKLYVYQGGSSGGGFKLSPSFSGGFGTGGYGGGGVGISLGGGGGNGGYSTRITYYFGASVGEMSQVTPMNFVDVMSDIMGDEPQVVEAIQKGKFSINKMDNLIKYYKDVKTSHKN